ncbi:hypothetical protein MHYP_G00343070 [Metynnis hypsauchen]
MQEGPCPLFSLKADPEAPPPQNPNLQKALFQPRASPQARLGSLAVELRRWPGRCQARVMYPADHSRQDLDRRSPPAVVPDPRVSVWACSGGVFVWTGLRKRAPVSLSGQCNTGGLI